MPSSATTINNNSYHQPPLHHQTMTSSSEVELRSFGDSFDHWREFYLSSAAATTTSAPPPPHVNRSGGFSYSNSPQTKNRFILWRVNNTLLELSEFDLNNRLDDSSIRINFSSNIHNSDISIFEYNQQYIVIIVLLETNILYRFTFVHPCASSFYELNKVGNKRKQDLATNNKSIFHNISISDLENSASVMRSPLIGGGENVEITTFKVLSPTRLCLATNHSNHASWIELSDIQPSSSSSSQLNDIGDSLVVTKKIDLKEGGFFSSLIPSKYSSTSSSLSPVQDIQFLQPQHSNYSTSSSSSSSSYVFVLHTDNTIRIWSAQEKQCLFTFTINTENWSQALTPSSRKLFKLFNHDLNMDNINLLSFTLVLYVEMQENESHFQFYSGLIEPNNTRLQLQRVSYTKSTGLIDFNVTLQNDTLYALFKSSTTATSTETDQAGTYSIEYISCAGIMTPFLEGGSNINIDEYSENLNMEYNIFYQVDIAQQQSANEKPPSSDSIESHYLERLFNRGYFSNRSIQKALAIYSPSYVVSSTTPLEYQISKLIKSKISNLSTMNNGLSKVDRKQPEEEEMLTYNEWNEFYQICLTQAKNDIQPTGLYINHSLNIIFVIKKNKLSIIRNNSSDTFDALLSSTVGSETFKCISSQKLEQQFLVQNVQLRNVEYVLECCKMIDKSINYDYSSLEYDIQRSQTNTALVSEVNSHILTCSIGSDTRGTDQHSKFVVEFTKLFKMIENPIKTISSLIVLLNEDFEKQSSLQNINDGSNSDLFSDIVVSFFKQTIQSRYHLCRSLSLLLCIVTRLRSQLKLSSSQLLSIEQSLIPTTYRILNTYYTLYWFTNQLYYPPSTNSSLEKMNLLDKKQQRQQHQQFKSSLLFILVSQNVGYFSTLTQNNVSFLDDIQQQIGKLFHLLAYQKDIFPIATYLTEKQQFKQLSVLLTMVQKNQPTTADGSITNISSYYYLMGLCFAHFSKYSEAYQYLIKSSESLKTQDDTPLDSIDRHIQHICLLSSEELVPTIFTINTNTPPPSPSSSTSHLLQKLFLKCSKVFELRNQLEYCIQLSLLAIQYSPQYQSNDISLIYMNIFKFAIKMSQYQVAYQATIMNPNRKLMLECLEKLVVILSEGYGKNNVLESLPFVGIYQHVESILLNKARGQDLLVSPDYYSILYSLQMNHSNYSKAAAIIYEKSQRILSETSGTRKGVVDTLNLYQTKLNYLSMAINCLNLLENENNRWISIDEQCLDTHTNNSNKRKVNSNIILSFQKDNDNSESVSNDAIGGNQYILCQKDIKKEYLFYSCHFIIYQNQQHQDQESHTFPNYFHENNVQQQQSNLQLIQKLLQHGMIDKCFSLAIENDLDMSNIFKTFTKMCIEYELDPTKNPFTFSPQSFDTYNLHYLNDNVKIVWSLLEKYLKRYDYYTTDPALVKTNYQTTAANNRNGSQQSRVFGHIVFNSMKQNNDGFISFQISSTADQQDNNNKLDVVLVGIDDENNTRIQKYLPPFFKEGYGVVLEGNYVEGGKFEARVIYCKSGIENCQQPPGYYYELVANQILEYPLQQLSLPGWLLYTYFYNGINKQQQQQQPSLSRLVSLFKLYYKNNRVEEAAKTLESIFTQAISMKHNTAVANPITLVDFTSTNIDQFMIECKQLLYGPSGGNKSMILEDSIKKSLEKLYNSIKTLISQY